MRGHGQDGLWQAVGVWLKSRPPLPASTRTVALDDSDAARQGQAHNLLRGMGVDSDWLELGKLQGAEDAVEEDDRKDVGGVEAREAASLRCGAHIQLRASVHRQLRRRQRAGWLLVMLVSVGMCNAASLLLFLCSHALKGFAVCIPAA